MLPDDLLPPAPFGDVYGGVFAARVGDLWQADDVSVDEYRGLQDRLCELAGDRTVSPRTVVRSADEDRDAWREAGAEHLALHPGSLDAAAERLAAFVR